MQERTCFLESRKPSAEFRRPQAVKASEIRNIRGHAPRMFLCSDFGVRAHTRVREKVCIPSKKCLHF